MAEKKVFYLVQNDTVRCYFNLKQLAEENNLPYYTLHRRLLKSNTYKTDSYLIGYDTMMYNTKRYNTRL